MLAIKSYDDWSPTNEETDPLRKLSTYTDYVRSSYYKEGQLSPENEKSIEDGVRQKMLDDGLLKSDTSEDDTQQILAQVLAPQKNTQADARFVFNHLQNEDDADFSGAVPETVSTLARYLSLKANGSQYADELQPAVDDILSDAPLVKRAKISAVDRSEYSVVGVDREDGGRDLYTGPTADPNKLRGEIDSLLGSGALSSADLSKVDGYMAPINGGLSNQSELNRSQVYNDIVNKKIKSDPELSDWVNSDVRSRREAIESEQRTTGESVFDVAKNVITYPFIKGGELVYDYLSGDMFEDKAEPKYAKDTTLAQIVASDPVISKRFSTQEIEKFADNYTTTAVGPVFRADRPETGLGADRLGNPMVSIELVSSRKLFDAAIEKAPLTDDQKATASIVRENLFEANRPKLLAFVLEQDSDAVGGLATALAEGKTESEFLEGWLSNDNNYSRTMARVKQFGAGAFKTLFADIPLGIASLAGNEWSAKALSYLDKQQQDRAQFSKMFGDEYGVSFQILNALPQVGRDILLTVGLEGAGGALKTLVKAERMTSAVALSSASKAAFAGVDDVAATAIKNASVVGGEKGLGTAFTEAGRSLASKFGPNAPLFVTSFTSSATSSFGSIYNQLPENMTHEEKYKAAIGSALYSGLSTGVITVGMSLLGHGGVEAVGSRKIRALMAGEDEAALIAAGNKVTPVNKLNFRQAKGVYESLYNEGKAMKDAAFNRVARAAISGTYKNFLRTSLKGGLDEAVEEMLDQGIQMKLQDAALDRDTPMSEKVNEMFMTGVVSAGLGGIISAGTQLAPLSKSDKSLMLESRASALNNIYTQLRKTNSNLTAEALQRNMDDANTKLRESLKQDALKQEQEKASKAEKDNTKAVADPTEKEYNPADLTAKPVALETFMEAFFRVPAAPTVDDIVEDTDVLDDFIGERVHSNGRYGILKLNEDDSVSLVEKNGFDLNLGQRYKKASGNISFDKKIMTTAEGVPFLTVGGGKNLLKFALPPQLENNSQIEKKYNESGKLVQLKLLKSPLLSDPELTAPLIVDNPYQIREVLKHYGIDFVRQSQIKPDQAVETPVVEEPVVETPVDKTPPFLKGLIDERDTAIEKRKEIIAKAIELDTAPEGETSTQKKAREKSNKPIVDKLNQEATAIEDTIKQLRSRIKKYSPDTIEMGEQGVKFVVGADPISMFSNMEESSQDPEVKLAASQAGNLLTLSLDAGAEESILNVLFTGDPTRAPFKGVAESLSLEQLGQLNLAADSLHNWAATNELSTSTLSPAAISFAGLETETQELDVLKTPTSEQKEARKIPNAIRSMAFTEAQRIKSRVGFALEYKVALEQPAEDEGIFGPEEPPVTFEPKSPMFNLYLALNKLESLVDVDAVGTPANRITQTINVIGLLNKIPSLPDRPELRKNLKEATKEINKALADVRKAYSKITDEDVFQYSEYLDWVWRSFQAIDNTYAPPEKPKPRVRPIKGIAVIFADDQFRIEPESEAFLSLVNGGFSITDLQGLGERLTQRYEHPTLGLQPLFSQSRLDLVEKGKEFADPRSYIKSKTAYLRQQVLEKYPATDWKNEPHTTRTSTKDSDQSGKKIVYPVKEIKKGVIASYIFTNDYNITRAQLNADGNYPIKVPASFDRATLNPALQIEGDVVTGYKEPTTNTVYAGGEHRPNNTNSNATILDSKSDSFSKASDNARIDLFGTILFEQAPPTPFKFKKRKAYNSNKEQVEDYYKTKGGRASREIPKATQNAYDQVFADLNKHIETRITNTLSTLTGFSGRKFNHLTVDDAVNVIRLAAHQKVEEHKLAHFLLNAVARSVSLSNYRLESNAQKTLDAYRESIGMSLSELPEEVRNALIKETLQSADVDNVDAVNLFKRAYPSMAAGDLAKLIQSAYPEIKSRSPNQVLNVFAKSLINRALTGDLRSLPNKDTVNKIATTVANRFDKQQRASRDDVANAVSIGKFDDLSFAEGAYGLYDTTPLDNLGALFSARRQDTLGMGVITDDDLSLLTQGLSAAPLSYFSLDSHFLDLGLETLSLLEKSVQENQELRDVFQKALEEYNPNLRDVNQEAIQQSDPQLKVGGVGIVSRLINAIDSDQRIGSEKVTARSYGFLDKLSKTDHGTRAAGLLISLGYFPPLKTNSKYKYLTSGVLFPAQTANIGTEAQRMALEKLEGSKKVTAAQELRLKAETGFTSEEAAEYYRLRKEAVEAAREELIVLNRTTNRAARVQDALQNRKREVFRELSLFIDAANDVTTDSNVNVPSLLLTSTDPKAIAAQATVKDNLLKYLEIDIGLTLKQIALHEDRLLSSKNFDDEGAYYAVQDESNDRLDYLNGKLERLRTQEANARAHTGGFNSLVSNLIVRLSQYSEGQEQVNEIVNGAKTKLRADLNDKADQLRKANDYRTVVAMAQLHPSVIEQTPAEQRTDLQVAALQRIAENREAAKEVEKQLSNRYAALIGDLTDKGWTVDSNNKLQYPTENIAPVSTEEQKQRYDDIVSNLKASGWVLSEVGELIQPQRFTTQPQEEAQPKTVELGKGERFVYHKTSNMESIVGGLEQRELGFSVAPKKDDVMSSPTLSEGRGTGGIVKFVLSGRGLDYTKAQDKKLIDDLYDKQTVPPLDVGVLNALRKMGIAYVDNFSGVGEAIGETHVLDVKALRLVDEATEPKTADSFAEKLAKVSPNTKNAFLKRFNKLNPKATDSERLRALSTRFNTNSETEKRRLDFSDSQDQQQFALAQEAAQIAADLNLYGGLARSTPKGKNVYEKNKSGKGVSYVEITPDPIITPIRTTEEEAAARVRAQAIYEGKKLEPYELERMKAQGAVDLETRRTGALPPEYDFSTYGDRVVEQAAKARATIENRAAAAAKRKGKDKVNALSTRKDKLAPDVFARHREDFQSQSTLDPQLRDAAIASNNREKDSLGLVSGDSDSVINALRIIAKTGTQTHRKLAQLLLLAPDYIKTISFNIVEYNSDSAGLYDPEENSVTINLREHNGRGLADVLLHEYAHAITAGIILNPETAGQRVAVDRITRIRELAIIQAKAKGLYGNRTIQMGLKNNSELLAYALTAQEFKVLFNGLTPNGERSLFTRIVDAIMQLFGVSDNNPELANALQELFDFTKMSLAHFHTYNVSAARDMIALDAAMDSDRDSYRTHFASELQAQETLARADNTRFMRTEAEPVGAFDREYLAAVEAGDTETMRRMVDEAAKAAGYLPNRLYHGSAFKFSQFLKKKLGISTGAGSAREGFFFTTRQETAEWFRDNAVARSTESHARFKDSIEQGLLDKKETIQRYQELIEKEKAREQPNEDLIERYGNKILQASVIGKPMEIQEIKPTIYESYVSLKNPLVYDYKGNVTRAETYIKLLTKAKEEGHDGAILRNTYDSGGNINGPAGEPEDIYVVFEPNQIKSADPVTYDEQGNVIPLSQRFDLSSNDIRYVNAVGGTGLNPNKIDPIYEMQRILPDGITLEYDTTLAGALGVRRSKPNTIIVNPDIFQSLGRGLSAANGRAAVRTALDEELAHIAADAEFSEQDYEDLASEMGEDMLIAIADLNYANMQPDFAARQALIADDRKSGVLSDGNIAAEFVRMRITEISKGRVREEDLAFLYTNPNVLERFLAGLKAYIAKLRQLFSSSPTTATASKISMAAREFRKISNGGVTPQPEPSIAGDLGDTTHFLNALNGDIVEGQQDRVEFQLPVDTTGDPSRIAAFWKAAEDKMYDLPSTLRQIVNKRNAALAKHQYSMKELAKLFPKLRDQALDSGILIEDIGILFGTTAPQISKIARRDIEKQVREFKSSNKSDDATVSAANDVAANKLKQTLVDAAASAANTEFRARQQAMEESVRRSGHGELVDLVVDFRNEINKTKEQIKFDDSNNVYLTRSYRFHQSEGWALAARSGGLTEIDGQVVDFDKLRLAATSHFVSVVESKAKEEGKTLTPDERDQLTMVALDKYLAELQQESEDNKKFAKDFTGLKNVRRDIDRLLQKHDIDKPLRELLGEVTDPLENAVRTLYSVGRLAANDKFLRAFAKAAIDLGLASKTPKQGMVVPFFAKDANELNEFAGLYVTENIAAALKNELGSQNREHETRSQSVISFVGKTLSVGTGVAMTTKTIGGVGFYPRNVLGGVMLTTAQGIANPLNAREAFKLAFLANSAVLADSDEEQRQQVRRLVELQIVRDDTSGRVTTDLLRGFVTNMDDQMDELITELMKAQETGKTDKLMSMLKSPLKTVASGFFKAADIGAALNNITDSMFKVNAYLYELSVLKEAYGDSVALSTLEVRAARKVKAVFPTHSDQISFAKTFNRSPYSMVVMPFIRWKSEVMRTMFNTIPLAMEEINSGNSVEVGRGVKRLVGFFSTVSAAPFLVGGFFSLLFAALSGDDDDDKNRALTDEEEATLRLGLPQWQRNNSIFTRLVGGKVQVVNLTNITPYSLLTDMVSIIARGASNGNFDIQGLASYFTGEVVGSNIAFNAVDQVRRNENEFGDPIVTENDDALQSSLKILGHLGKGIVVPSAYGFLEKATRFGEQDRGMIVAGELTGARPMQHDLSDIERRAMFNVKNQLDESVAILRPIYSNRAVPLDDIPVLVTEHQDSLNKTQTNFTKIIAGLKSLGSNTQSLAKSAKAVGLSQQRLLAAAAGKSLSWRPNGDALNKIRFNKGQGEEQDYASVQEALLDAVSKKPPFYSSTSDD